MKIILHIGSDKTGTTTIQHNLASQRSTLLELGIDYPDLAKNNNHECLAKEVIEGKQGRHWQKLLKIINNSTADITLLSSEMFCSFTKAQVRRLRIWLEDYTVQIICYVRKASEYLESGLLQRLKSCGSELQFKKALYSATKAPFFLNIPAIKAGLKNRFVGRWQQEFKKELIIVRPYTQSHWKEKSLIHDFFINALNQEPKFDVKNVTSLNITPSIEVVYCYQIFNRSSTPWLKHDFSNVMTNHYDYQKKAPITSKRSRVMADLISRFLTTSSVDFDHKKKLQNRQSLVFEEIKTAGEKVLIKYIAHQIRHPKPQPKKKN